MTRDIHWSEVVEHAAATLVTLAPLAPPPASAVLLAAGGIARALSAVGCAILECPAEVAETLQPADLPTGDRGHDARARAVARAAGLDHRGLADRSTAAQDADELLRPALVQRIRAAARGPSELHVVDAVLLRAARGKG